MFQNFRTFDKSMTLKEFIKYKVEDDFSYLVIEACNDQFYGFNLRNKEEKNQAKNIVRDSDWYVVGWKVSRELPSWVKKAKYWADEIVKKNIIEQDNDCEIVDDKVNDERKDDNNDERDKMLMMTKMMMKRKPELKTTL